MALQVVRFVRARYHRVQQRVWPIPDDHDQATRTRIVIDLRKTVCGLMVWMLGLSTGVTIALVAEHVDNDKTTAATAIQCNRSKEFGPFLEMGYARYHFMPPKMLEDYEKTIPHTCPH